MPSRAAFIGRMQARSLRGDPGLFGALGRLLRKGVKAVPGVGTAAALFDIGSALLPPGVSRGKAVATAVMGALPGASTALALGPAAARAIVGPRLGGGPFGLPIGRGAPPMLPGAVAGRRRRRMNPLNPRALTRAVRRLVGFQKRVSRVERLLGRIRRGRGRPARPFRRRR